MSIPIFILACTALNKWEQAFQSIAIIVCFMHPLANMRGRGSNIIFSPDTYMTLRADIPPLFKGWFKA